MGLIKFYHFLNYIIDSVSSLIDIGDRNILVIAVHQQ